MLSIVAWTLCVQGVCAQNALDASLHVGSGGQNKAKPQEDYRSRNLVVTGDVASGRGFRGSVGYTAEGDFRGGTGGDASIGFRSNSALSNPAVIRSMSSSDSFSMARDAGATEFRRDFSGPSKTGQSSFADTPTQTRQRLDLITTQLSTSNQRGLEAASTPIARYAGRDEGDAGVLTVSTVRGVKRESDRDRKGIERLSLYEAARLREDFRNGLSRMDSVRSTDTNPFRVASPQDSVNISSTRDAPRPTHGDVAALATEGRQSAYDQIIRQIRDNWMAKENGPSSDDVTVKPESLEKTNAINQRLESAYQQLKQQLEGGAVDESNPVTATGAAGLKTGDATQVDSKKEDGTTTTEKPGDAKRAGINMTLDDYAIVLKHGTTLQSFGDGDRGRIDELLADGQRAMHEGNSFIAEKRFEVALILRPNDPRVTAGLLHCQIGANLLGSATVTLRALLINHPEMMDVTYSPEAMPPQARIDAATAGTRARLKLQQDGTDYGVLLAYLGHLTGDRSTMQEGIDAIKGTPANDAMSQLLRKIWLTGPTKSGIEAVPPAGGEKNAAQDSK